MDTYKTAFEINSELFGGDEHVDEDDVRIVQKILEQRIKDGQHEPIVMLRKSLVDDYKRINEIVLDSDDERDRILYEGMCKGIKKAIIRIDGYETT